MFLYYASQYLSHSMAMVFLEVCVILPRDFQHNNYIHWISTYDIYIVLRYVCTIEHCQLPLFQTRTDKALLKVTPMWDVYRINRNVLSHFRHNVYISKLAMLWTYLIFVSYMLAIESYRPIAPLMTTTSLFTATYYSMFETSLKLTEYIFNRRGIIATIGLCK